MQTRQSLVMLKILTLFVAMGSVQISLAEQLDQENNPPWSGGRTNIQTVNQVGQSFRPFCMDLISVDVDLIYQGGFGDVTATILRNGSEIASAQTFISTSGWTPLVLDSIVNVTPDENLVLRLESDTFPLPLWKYAGDTYPVGTRLLFGSPQTGDFFFRTYSSSCGNVNIEVEVDIKPGSDPNSINLCSNGAVPIAILGSDTFDVFEVNTETLRFAEASVKVVGKKDPHTLCSYEDVNGDSFDDLVCHFVTSDIAALDGDSTFATVNGELFEEFGGTAIQGTDNVNIVKDMCN